ncbi:MAG: Formamidopyrimidine-DNA glycosylase [Opitutia bacterium UBA7350]|nr:MAG: Formamidopyrimidine-DNA glycosylase [Opitutae bacterium UBA7350]
MPELAEVELSRRVWTIAEGLTLRGMSGNALTRIYRDCSLATLKRGLRGAVLVGSRTHGKRMFFEFKGGITGKGRCLELHLGMTGRLTRSRTSSRAHKHDHFVLKTREWNLAFNDYRQFGRLFLHAEGFNPVVGLPMEVLSKGFSLAHMKAIQERRSKRALKAVLLDQAFFPGVGNWMADEICWRLGYHPAVPLGQFEAASVRRVSRMVCRGAMKHIADGNTEQYQEEVGFSPGNYVKRTPPADWLFRHRWKAGGACPKCSRVLDRGVVATRTTAWCSSCQVSR